MPSSWTVLIAVHAVAASYALIFGAVNLLRRTKGGSLHRIVGRIWVVAMYIVVLTSFGIRTIDGGFNWLHALSALTFGTLTAGLWAVRTGNIRAHRSFMTGSYFGLIGAFVGVLAVPSRRIPQLAIHELPLLGLLILVLLGTAAMTVLGLARLRKAQRPLGAG
ncbi:DUF2306 domain-containing protein [Paenarthrobacter ureafaciens]|jgi:uncharacterized membrane protein|uniref:DUF2306 domain-containing protein n=1 Tax=Paenarthrobacter TaxID=1742992 RepID=UPI00074D2D42|nr:MULTISPECIES: DUF2306 domain-containing protein [Paenarthrobacter]AMB41969.1 hypothetical protein AUT26_18440 [Arthrobacter sp. ATCC 21022]NKR12799.1 hypothetical protein [Arthrobacter sp. M5]NKR16129.1 hypothetical protein [Arthrobacter sp. M6]OEH59012.1 hypothetical protein A5N13_20575 [Arthrobacter sp. D4]OEH59148.1 hypothetical protein A5N17_19425 [Arthrobacter sp. D2]BCW86003.1 hypothetical protein NicSoilE8_36760 [Arthrobacter sp. NicSoilE8]